MERKPKITVGKKVIRRVAPKRPHNHHKRSDLWHFIRTVTKDVIQQRHTAEIQAEKEETRNKRG